MTTRTHPTTTALMKLTAHVVDVALETESKVPVNEMPGYEETLNELRSLSTDQLEELQYILRRLAEMLDAIVELRKTRGVF